MHFLLCAIKVNLLRLNLNIAGQKLMWFIFTSSFYTKKCYSATSVLHRLVQALKEKKARGVSSSVVNYKRISMFKFMDQRPKKKAFLCVNAHIAHGNFIFPHII